MIGRRPSHMGRLGDANAIFGRGFKGLKQAIKLEYKLGQYDKVCLHLNVVVWLLTNTRQRNITKSFLLT